MMKCGLVESTPILSMKTACNEKQGVQSWCCCSDFLKMQSGKFLHPYVQTNLENAEFVIKDSMNQL